jgi:hypothetical protein
MLNLYSNSFHYVEAQCTFPIIKKVHHMKYLIKIKIKLNYENIV